jgi:RNA polymerase sigma factor (sigma-70 family)
MAADLSVLQRLNATDTQPVATATTTIKVFLLDDHEIVRRGIRALLETDPRIEVVGEASSVGEALLVAPFEQPDVAVLDVRLPDGSGIYACQQLRDAIPGLKCLMVTSFADPGALGDAIAAGASGYVLKQLRGTDVLSAVLSVARGGSAFDSQSTAMMMEEIRARAEVPAGLETITQREREVLDLIGEGMTNNEIADRLGIAEKTVRNTVSVLLNKLGMQHRTQAAIYITKLRAAQRKAMDLREQP